MGQVSNVMGLGRLRPLKRSPAIALVTSLSVYQAVPSPGRRGIQHGV